MIRNPSLALAHGQKRNGLSARLSFSSLITRH
jgi:hypothetical protein